MSHDKQRDVATERWNTVRAEVKSQLAARQMAAGDVQAAAVELATARRLDPDDPALALLQAKVFLAQDEFEQARRLLTSVRADGAPGAEAHYLLGVIAQQRLESDIALRHFEAAATLAPDEIAYLSAVVQTLLQQGEAEEAERRLNAAEERLGWKPGFYACLAEVHEQRGRFEQAAAAWRRVASAAGDDPEIQERLAIALLRAQRYDEAIPVLEGLLENSGRADALGLRLSLAACLLEMHRYDEAEQQAARVLQRASTAGAGQRPDLQIEPEALALLARLSAERGDLSRAQRLAERALGADPQDPDLIKLTAALAVRAGDTGRARRLVDPLLAGGPPTPIDGKSGIDPVLQRILEACRPQN